MRSFCAVVIAACALLVVSCADTGGDPADGTSDNAQVKEQARTQALANGGKNDLGEDICATYGFYGDGVCDTWCSEPDSDCGPCDYPDLVCADDELAIDANETGCPDTCVDNPDYYPPGQVALDEACERVDDCQEDAYCAKEMGRCDDGEPGICTLKPDCADLGEFVPDYVCDCEGISHGRPCDAQYLGRNLRHAGLCPD